MDLKDDVGGPVKIVTDGLEVLKWHCWKIKFAILINSAIKQLTNLAPENVSGYKDVYKIKLRSVGCRLVYEVNNTEITVYIIAVGKRDRGIRYVKPSLEHITM